MVEWPCTGPECLTAKESAMKQRLKLWVVAFCGLFAPVAAQGEAASTPGSPEFEAAVDLWLQGKEEPAIRAFAELAPLGDSDAQLMLGLIDITPVYQGAWVRSLSRSDRLALLRAEGGISGRNWIEVAAQVSPHAQTWLQLWDGDAKADVMLAFAQQGEARAAHMAARTLFSREKRGFGALADDPAFPEMLQPVAILDWQHDAPEKAKAAIAVLPAGAPGKRLLGLGDPVAKDLYAWAESHPQGQAFLTTLAALCPASTAPAADMAAYFAQAGGSWGWAWIGPPAENLIDPVRYAESPKAVEAAANLLRSRPLAAPELIAASPCMAGLMAQRAKAP